MFNPFVPFEARFIDAFRKAGKRYLVSQTYAQAVDHFADRNYLLFTHYDELGRAKIHLSALKDRFAAIIDLENERHRTKIQDMLAPESIYVIYSTLVESREKLLERLNQKYSDNIRRYISNNTSWRIGSDKTIRPAFEIVFGEFFVLLKYSNQQLRVKLQDIEKA
jgi:tRNA A58 N-methylase Trm61